MISILLPVHNEGNYVQEAITSVIDQSYRDWELIIVDNGSTDNTREICYEYSQVDSRIKFFKLDVKHKIKAHNFAYEQSIGNIICFFCGDDTLPENSLEERVKFFLKNPGDNIFTTCLLKTFSKNKKYDNNVFPRNPKLPNYSAGSIMFQKIVAEKIFPIPEVLPNEDTWTQLHLRSFNRNIHIPKALYNYRIHQNNSYGYDLPFKTKRQKFLKRMYAYDIFYEKYENENIPFIKEYIKSYIEATNIVRETRLPFKLLYISNINIYEKLKFLMYSNKLLFSIRYIFFKLFSGISN